MFSAVWFFLAFSKGFIHLLFKDLYHLHKVGFKVFLLCFYCIVIFWGCCSRMAGIWWYHIALAVVVFLNWRLGIKALGDYRSKCWFLSVSLLNGYSFLGFYFPFVILVFVAWTLTANVMWPLVQQGVSIHWGLGHGEEDERTRDSCRRLWKRGRGPRVGHLSGVLALVSGPAEILHLSSPTCSSGWHGLHHSRECWGQDMLASCGKEDTVGEMGWQQIGSLGTGPRERESSRGRCAA